MRSIQFTFVFWGLMGLSVISAFVLPTSATAGKSQLAHLFTPVSYPVSKIAAWTIGRRSAGAEIPDISIPHTVVELRNENDQLRVAISNLTAQLEQLRQRASQLSKLGSLADRCILANTTGGDSGTGESLTISATSSEGVKSDMAVLEAQANLVGKITQAGIGGSTVKLLSDRSTRVLGRFARFVQNSDGRTDFIRIPSDPLHIEGAGEGKMIIRAMPHRQIKDADIRESDWVVLDDPSWPSALQGYRIGKVAKVQASKSPGFDEVEIQPEHVLRTLPEVMVMVK
jgi:hypothetical protein